MCANTRPHARCPEMLRLPGMLLFPVSQHCVPHSLHSQFSLPTHWLSSSFPSSSKLPIFHYVSLTISFSLKQKWNSLKKEAKSQDKPRKITKYAKFFLQGLVCSNAFFFSLPISFSRESGFGVCRAAWQWNVERSPESRAHGEKRQKCWHLSWGLSDLKELILPRQMP